MRVVSLHRYPVKSLLGEAVSGLDVDARGVAGDRLWSVRTADGKIGSGKSTRRFAAVIGLLELRARLGDGSDDGVPLVEFRDGRRLRADDPAAAAAISELVGQPVTLARETDVSHFDDGPVSIIGLGSVGAVTAARGEPVEPDRFRANIVLDSTAAWAEEQWLDRKLRIGGAVLQIELRSPRCVMVNMATADLAEQAGNLALLGRLNDGHLGVIGTVVQPGRISVGDEIEPL